MITVRQGFLSLYNKGRALLKITFVNTSHAMLRSFFVVSFVDRYTKGPASFSAIYWPAIFNDFESLKAAVTAFLKQYSISTTFFEGLTKHESTSIYELDSEASSARSRY